jgi:D-galactarolactone cycloisomerase
MRHASEVAARDQKIEGRATLPHVWGSVIAVAAALQAIVTIPASPHTANPIPLLNGPIVEFDRKSNPLREDLLERPFELVNGCLAVSDRPGLGVTVRDEVLDRYAA